MTNSEVKEQLKLLYGWRDVLTGENVKNKKSLTLHHIQKKAEGGATTVINGCLLLKETHEWLNRVEVKDKAMYYLINDCILCYQECMRKGLSEEVQMFEKEIQPKIYSKVRKKEEV